MSDALAPEVVIWTDPSHAALVQEVMVRMGGAARAIALGGPRHAAVDDAARALGVSTGDDLRQMLNDTPAAFVLYASLNDPAAKALPAAIAHGSIIMAIEPPVAGVDTLASFTAQGGSGRICSVPSFRESPGWRSAAEPFSVAGPPRSIAMSSFGNPTQASPIARLLDAWTAVLAITELPETVDCSAIGPQSAARFAERGADGYLNVHARMPHGSAALLRISNRAGVHGRSLEALCDQGIVTISDTAFRIDNPQGEQVDASTLKPAIGPRDFAGLIVEEWRRMIDRGPSATPLPTTQATAEALACCQACLLSAKTGQSERPANLLEMYARAR